MTTITLTCGEADRLLGQINRIRERPLPERAAYRTRKLRNKLRAELKEYQQSIQRLVREHAPKDATGRPCVHQREDGSVTFEPEDQAAFEAAMRELQSETVHIEHIEITESLFGAAIETIPAQLLDDLCEVCAPLSVGLPDGDSDA